MGNAAPAGEVSNQGIAIGKMAKDLLGHAVVLALVDAAAMAYRDTSSILATVLKVEEGLVEVDSGRDGLGITQLHNTIHRLARLA